MARTVHELRNAIRSAVGRFERETSTSFTKEDLAAVAEAVGDEIDRSGQLPATAAMRATILERVGVRDPEDTELVDRSFRKAELQAILAALESD